MKATIKLVTGMVPVALGVMMALVPGMAKAEEKAAQPQPMTNAVSAQTTLPSVGHRPATPIVSNWSLQGGNQSYTSSLLLPVGSRLGAHTFVVTPKDRDNTFGANEYTDDRKCRIYRVSSDSRETLIYDSGNNYCDSDRIYITENEIGHKIKIAHYTKTSPVSYSGYVANPTESLEHVFVTSQSVSDIYDVRKTKVSPTFQEIPHSDPKGIKVTIRAADFKNRPVTGLNIAIDSSPSSSTPSDAKLTYTVPVDNGDGSYTLYVKSTRANSHYFVKILMNGTVGDNEHMIAWSFN